PVDTDRLAAVDRKPGVATDGHGPQAPGGPVWLLVALPSERVPADEFPLAEPDERRHAGLERRVLHRQLRPVVAEALLQAEGLEGPVADRLRRGPPAFPPPPQ